jgi:hypothetical protein
VEPYGSGLRTDRRIVQIRFFGVDLRALWEGSVGTTAEKVEESGADEEDADDDADDDAGDCAGREVLRTFGGGGATGGSASRVSYDGG